MATMLRAHHLPVPWQKSRRFNGCKLAEAAAFPLQGAKII